MNGRAAAPIRPRAAYHCEYRRLPQEFSELRFYIEHVVPLQYGGGDDADNLALACPDWSLPELRRARERFS